MSKILSFFISIPIFFSYAIADEPISSPLKFNSEFHMRWEYHDSPKELGYVFYHYKSRGVVRWDHNPHVIKTSLKTNARYVADDFMAETQLKATCSIDDERERMNVEITKAYFAYKISENKVIVVGRCPFEDIYDSKIQFGSVFNGAHVNTEYKQFKLSASGMVVPEGRNFFGAVGHATVTPFSFPIAFNYHATYWGKQENARETVGEYFISQLSFNYIWDELVFNQPLQFKGGVLKNHKQEIDNKAWYVGYSWGVPTLTLKNQYNLSVFYQETDEQVTPKHDLAGIAKGKAVKGFVIEAAYAVTDQLSIKGKAHLVQLTNIDNRTQNYFELGATCKF